MYEWIRVTESAGYIQSPARVGIVLSGDGQVCLIDGGNGRDAAKRIKRLIDEEGAVLTSVFCTHSHADHIGGAAYLQKQTGCRIFARGIERDFARHTVLEPDLLFGGRSPGELRHKFLMAQECEAEELTEDILPDGMQIIPLPGHSFDMVGFRTPDDVVYLADSVSSRETIEKYRICYIYDVAQYLETLNMLKTMTGRLFIPAHTEPTENIAELAQINIDSVEKNAEAILSLCAEPASFESILKGLFDAYDLRMTVEQYALVGSTLRAYLSWLRGAEYIDLEIQNNLLLWHRQ